MDAKEVLKQLGPYIKKYGFKRKGKLCFVIKNDIACCLEIEKPSQCVYVTYYVIPLYIPHENRCYTYGNRINLEGARLCGNIYQNQDSVDETSLYENLGHYIETNVIPFFERFGNASGLIDFAKDNESNDCIFCEKIYKLRLLFLSYTFIGEYSEALKAAKKYRIALQTTNWLTKAVKEKWMKEIEDITVLLQERTGELSAWHSQVIENTLKVCSLG